MPATTTLTVKLNNGVEMPTLGLGVFQSPPEETTTAVEAAIADGYHLVDTAAAYGNEREVGEAIRRSGIDRGEMFVTTKLWISDYGSEGAQRGIDGCLRRLGFDYVDLFLLHQPVPAAFDDTIAAYTELEKALAAGRARAIGVSNFSERHLEDLISRTDVVPSVNQVELHPFFTQQSLRDFHASRGITTEAWSPLGGVNVYRPADPNAVKNPLEHPTVTGLTARYGKTPAQVVLRWHIEHGVVAIPKSVKPHRIKENFGVFDFALKADEVASIDALDTGVRGGPRSGDDQPTEHALPGRQLGQNVAAPKESDRLLPEHRTLDRSSLIRGTLLGATGLFVGGGLSNWSGQARAQPERDDEHARTAADRILLVYFSRAGGELLLRRTKRPQDGKHRSPGWDDQQPHPR